MFRLEFLHGSANSVVVLVRTETNGKIGWKERTEKQQQQPNQKPKKKQKKNNTKTQFGILPVE